MKPFTWIKRNPEKYGNNKPALDALIYFSPFWITSLMFIYLFISGIVNAQIPVEINPKLIVPSILFSKIEVLEKRIDKLEKVINAYIEKSH